jgi:uncharacterized repeat protein (TIGR01451 family)/fimbrial isopeptide formation D2 family protein
VTAGGGIYGFDNLPAGDYTISVDPTTVPVGLAAVFDLDGAATADTATAPLADGETRLDLDFGYQLQADLAIDKSHTGDFAIGLEADGVTNTWTIEVTNLGPATAEAPVVVTDTLPDGITYLRSVGDDWDCSISDQDLTCTLVDGVGADTSLPSGATVSVDVVVEADASAAPGVTNTASVTTSSVDPDPDNDTDDDPTEVPLSILTIEKVIDGDADQGRQATYVITVANSGPTATRGDVIITDQIPTGLTFVEATSETTTATCAEVDGLVTCTHPDSLAVNDTWSVRITATVTALAGASIINIGQVEGGNEVNGTGLGVVTPVEDIATAVVTTPPRIAFTGAETATLLIGAMMILALGSAMVLLSRRRIDPV